MPRRKPAPDPRRGGRPPSAPRPNPAREAERAARARAVCASKDRYASDAEARAFALMHHPAVARGARTRPVPYRCEVCGGWHLTSRA